MIDLPIILTDIRTEIDRLVEIGLHQEEAERQAVASGMVVSFKRECLLRVFFLPKTTENLKRGLKRSANDQMPCLWI